MRSTPCSGTALRTVCSGSVRGGSKVGRARAAFGAAQCMKPLPPLAVGGHQAFRLVAPPPRPAPGVCVNLPGRACWGGGAPSGVCALLLALLL